MALRKVRNCFKCIETCIVSNNYFRSISGLPPAPYPECQPSQSALEQNRPEYLMSLTQLKVNSINRLLDPSEMYHDGNTASTTSTPPIPRGSITPVTMAKAFCPIQKMAPVSPGAQSAQVSHTQALNLLQDTQVTEKSTVRKPTLVKIVEQLMDQSDSSTVHTQRQPVTLVSFV